MVTRLWAGDKFMDTFEFVIAIVSIVFFFSLIREFIRRRRGSVKVWNDWLEESGLEISDERLEALERRVQVLERIAVDKKHMLSEEIERL
jgi:LPS sulfotransferase NodH